MAKLTGYKIREAIADAELARDALSAEFNDSLYAFEGENKQAPEIIMSDYEDEESRIAILQTIQARYNLAVVVEVLGEKLTLAEAVKQVGGAGRVAAMWKNALTQQRTGGYYLGDSHIRDKDSLVARPTMTHASYMECSRDAARYASALRNAIAEGNATIIELDDALVDVESLLG